MKVGELTIREAVVEDLQAITEIYNEAIRSKEMKHMNVGMSPEGGLDKITSPIAKRKFDFIFVTRVLTFKTENQGRFVFLYGKIARYKVRMRKLFKP